LRSICNKQNIVKQMDENTLQQLRKNIIKNQIDENRVR